MEQGPRESPASQRGRSRRGGGLSYSTDDRMYFSALLGAEGGTPEQPLETGSPDLSSQRSKRVGQGK